MRRGLPDLELGPETMVNAMLIKLRGEIGSMPGELSKIVKLRL